MESSSGEGQIHRSLERSFVCGFEGMSISSEKIILESSMVEHSAVNRRVVGSSPTRGVFLYHLSEIAVRVLKADPEHRLYVRFMYGSVVKRSRHRPFTAVTRVRFPSESFEYGVVAKW